MLPQPRSGSARPVADRPPQACSLTISDACTNNFTRSWRGMSGRDQTHSARSPLSCALLTRVDMPDVENLAPRCRRCRRRPDGCPGRPDIGHRLGQNASSGNGQQVALTLGARVLHQRGVIEPRGVRQNRRGHFDRVVECQGADHLAGRVGDRGEPAAERRTGSKLDVLDELAHDLVEQVDLIVGEPARAVDEKIGDTPQDFGALRQYPCSPARLRVGRSDFPARSSRDVPCQRNHGIEVELGMRNRPAEQIALREIDPCGLQCLELLASQLPWPRSRYRGRAPMRARKPRPPRNPGGLQTLA